MAVLRGVVAVLGTAFYPLVGLGVALVANVILGPPAIALLLVLAAVGSRALAKGDHHGLGHLFVAFGLLLLPLVLPRSSQDLEGITLGDSTWWSLAAAAAALFGVAFSLFPPRRRTQEEIDAELGGALPPGPIPIGEEIEDENAFQLAYDAIKVEFDQAIAALDSIGGRVATLPGLIIGLGALSLGAIRLDGPLYLLSLGLVVGAVSSAVVSLILAVLALRTRRFSFGPNPAMVFKYAGVEVANRKMALRSMALVTIKALEMTTRQAWFFNLSLAAAAASLLSVFMLRLIGGAEGG